MASRRSVGLAASILALFATASLDISVARGAAASTTERVLVVRRGDTLAGLLTGAGLDRSEVQATVTAIERVLPLRSLRPGQEVTIELHPSREDELIGVEIEPAPGRTVRARLEEDGWHVEDLSSDQHRMLAMAAGEVEGGLFPSMVAAGLPPGLAMSLIGTLGHAVDFGRDLQPGDRFSALFERLRDNDGELIGHGHVLQVELILSGRRLTLWRYDASDGSTDWVDAEGRSVRGSFLRTPLDGARVTSGFGLRRHPVLASSRPHDGIDFGASTGTPVYAAADGRVISARRENGYGRTVRLRHRGGSETRYAHLSRFAQGLAPGRAVKQGDTIGNVGSDGLSTGPHLHYEVLVAGKPVDPSTHVSAQARLSERQLAEFQAARLALAEQAATLRPYTEVAMIE
ncbi:peptidoglycan DD-metalloendopeptidase family protein (plasmid) [Roseomonas sp. CCTCC AB2023176]|uniref:M23 family metallopeptidase n=1 Tax=Roseomonas sp. CCTCC AB2023176 TaxID=3342640 RepID=UPI0035D8E253